MLLNRDKTHVHALKSNEEMDFKLCRLRVSGRRARQHDMSMNGKLDEERTRHEQESKLCEILFFGLRAQRRL